MQNIAIVTDSSAYLSAEFVKKNNIHVIPLRIHWDEETLLDGIDINPSQFYERLEKSATIPSTSQPSAGDFIEVFDRLSQDHDAILALLISSGISGTVDSAELAIKMFNKIPVVVIDSLITSAGLGMIVKVAVQAVAEGKNIQEIQLMSQKIIRTIKTFFVVDTLKYLHKGGRIGGASRYLGSALDIKPILYFDDQGKIEALEKVRTKRNALERLMNLAEEHSKGKNVVVSLIHANSLNDVTLLKEKVEKRFACKEVDIYELSPVIGTHVGPGTLGIALYPENIKN